MCGIVGYVGKKNNALQVLIEGLENLEYRGYDSAGVAFLNKDKIDIIKKQGKIKNLKQSLPDLNTNIGIGHTRWATHGVANETNSHPHKCGKMTIVHNGIIENYEEIKRSLINSGYKFKTETDTEVACALIDNIYSEVKDITKTIEIFQKKVRGSYAIGLVCDDDYENLYAIKKNSPLIIAHGENENYIASDMPAILKFTKNFIALNDGDFAKISANDIKVFNKDGIEINKELKSFEGDLSSIDKNGYEHYMQKEIMEQPEVIKKTMNEYLTNNLDNLFKNMPDFSKYKKIHIVACGSAMHAGLVGKSLIEEYANVPVDVEIASEFRYKKLFLDENSLVIAVSQSGETADTLAAVEIAKKNNADTLGIINVVGSSIARESDLVLYTKAGSEIAVATTKAYSAQTALLSLIALNIGQKNISKAELKELLESIKKLPAQMEILLNKDKKCLYTGYWKVYSDLEKKLQTFLMFTNCRNNLLEMLSKGFSLEGIMERMI